MQFRIKLLATIALAMVSFSAMAADLTIKATPTELDAVTNQMPQTFSFSIANAATIALTAHVTLPTLPKDVVPAAAGSTCKLSATGDIALPVGASCTLNYSYAPINSSPAKETVTLQAKSTMPGAVPVSSSLTINKLPSILKITPAQTSVISTVGATEPVSFSINNPTNNGISFNWSNNDLDNVSLDKANTTCVQDMPLAAGQSCVVSYNYSPTKVSAPNSTTKLYLLATQKTPSGATTPIGASDVSLFAVPLGIHLKAYRTDLAKISVTRASGAPIMPASITTALATSDNASPTFNNNNIVINSNCPASAAHNEFLTLLVQVIPTNPTQGVPANACTLAFDCAANHLTINKIKTTCIAASNYVYNDKTASLYLIM